jgi:mono/diheme cytochrome c family protein
MQSNVKRRVLSVSAAALLIGSLAHAAEDVPPGEAMYRRYCGACHGPTGRGDGVASSTMRPPPTNLTEIAKQNGGTFPTMKVLHYVDGTEHVRAHGDPTMPVWGEVFREEAVSDMTRRVEVRGKVMEIVAYIESIQAK